MECLHARIKPVRCGDRFDITPHSFQRMAVMVPWATAPLPPWDADVGR